MQRLLLGSKLFMVTPSVTVFFCALGFLAGVWLGRRLEFFLETVPGKGSLLAVGFLLAGYSTFADSVLPYYLFWGLPGALLAGLFCRPSNFAEGSSSDTEALASSPSRASVYLVLLGLVVFGGWIRLPSLGNYGLQIDESRHVGAAYHYLIQHGSLPYGFIFDPTSLEYVRAWLFTWQTTMALDWLGFSLVSARLVSAVWGLLLFPAAYLLARSLRLTSLQTVLFFWWLAVSPFFITIARWVRMYGMFFVLFLLTVVAVERFLRIRDRRRAFAWGTVGLIASLIAVHLHGLTLTLIPGLLFFLGWEWFFYSESTRMHLTRERVGAILAAIGLVLAFTLLAPHGYGVYLSDSGQSLGEVDFNLEINHLFPVFLVHEPLGWPLGGILIGAALLLCRSTPAERLIMSVVCVSTLGFVLFSGRYMAFRYMGYLIPLGQCLVILGAFRLLDSFPDGTGRLPALVLLGLMVLVPVRELFFRLQTIWHGHMDMFSHLKILADLSY